MSENIAYTIKIVHLLAIIIDSISIRYIEDKGV